ncbi:hypothetical protein Tco_0093053 [Tanacetum coccineum]
METRREAKLANDLSKLMMELLVSVKERQSFIEDLESLRGNLVAYKTREKLKSLQKDDLVEVTKLRKIVLQLHRHVHTEFVNEGSVKSQGRFVKELVGVYQWTLSLLNHYTDAKDIWENVKMILEGSELTKDDRESQLYDEFEHFRQTKGETIQGYYVRFTKLINDMKNIKMTMPRMQLVGSRNHFTSYDEPRIELEKR